jgi:putative MATE family efflux protein
MTTFALQSTVGLVNTVIVAELGRDAVAGVGLATQIHFLAFAVLSAVTIGSVALVARASGAGEPREADRVLRMSAALGSVLGALMMLAIPFTETIVGAFGVAPPVVAVGGSYLRLLLLFNVPFAFGLVVSSGLRGAGDVRTPMAVGVVVNVLNVLGNYALVFGKWGAPELGTDGSALAGGLSFGVGAVLFLWPWARNALVIERGPWLDGFSRERAARILRIGVPTFLEQTAWQLGLWIFLRVVAEYGTEPVAAYLIGVRILSFSFVPGLGFAMAASTLVGQHLGAREPDLASRSGWRANLSAMGVMGALGLLIIGVARPVSGWFGATGEATVDLTVSFIWILGAAQPLMAVEFALGGALRGAGDTRFPLFAILAGLFVFRLGGAAIVVMLLHGTVIQVWSCLLADYAVKAALLSARFASGRWKEIAV